MKGLRKQNGIALLLVLWVLAILMVIVFSFSFLTRADITSTFAFNKGIEKKFIAEAGLNRAITEIFYRKDKTSLTEEGPWQGDGRAYTGKIGHGSYVVRMTDETGKVDINAVPDVILRKLLKNQGVEEDKISTIIDSIMDWKDPDDLYRQSGAESDYYQSLPDPYFAKNDKFDAPEELILVRGITRDMLYGSGEKKGIIGLLTVASGSGRINLKAAPKEVLLAVPGMTEVIADEIVKSRSIQEIKSLRDIQGIIGPSYALMSRYVTVADGKAFTIDAVGYLEGDKGGYAIRATVAVEGVSQYRYVYYKSPLNL